MAEKLKIEGFSDKWLKSSVGSCTLQINPETISHKYAVDVKPTDDIKTFKRVPKYATRELETLSFDFYLDGTGVVPGEGTVESNLTSISNIVYKYNGQKHQTNFLKVTWGTIEFQCALKSMDVTYELFSPTGVPLRAKVSMSFLEHITAETVAKMSKNSSPDLTHEVTVKPGDTLPLLCYDVYGDSSHYPVVARANGLDSIMSIEPGDRLRFPPVRT